MTPTRRAEQGGKIVTLVIAGSYQQFKYYYPKPDKEIIYVESANQLRGLHGFKVDRVGTWYDRPDIEEIERAIKEVQP